MTVADTSGQTPSRAGLTLATCCAVHGLQDGLTTTVKVMLPILAQSFGLSYAQIGTVRAANVAAMALLEIPSGLLSERIGARALLAVGLVIAGTGFLWLSAASGFTVILLSLFLAGAGAAFQHTLSSSLIAAAYPGRTRRAALGTYNAAGDVGKLALAGAFTLAIGLGLGWQAVARGFGAAALALALLVLALLVTGRISGRARPAAGVTPGPAEAPLGWGIRNKPAFASLCAISSLDTVVQSGFATFVAFLMIEKGVAPGLAALAVVLTLAGGVVGKFCCGFLAARLGVLRSLVLVQTLTATGIVAVVFLPPMAAYVLLPALGAVLQGSSSITYGSVSEMFHPDRQARGFSLVYSAANVASVASSILLGALGDWIGLTAMMLTIAGLTLLTLPLAPLLRSGLQADP